MIIKDETILKRVTFGTLKAGDVFKADVGNVGEDWQLFMKTDTEDTEIEDCAKAVRLNNGYLYDFLVGKYVIPVHSAELIVR